jgi:ParB family transcriptional regulator, chromosome partitioning protein
MARESSLGRGLGALLGAQQPRAGIPNPPAASLPIAALKPGSSQPRKTIHQQPLEELAASMQAKGVLQPILVRALTSRDGAVTHEIVAGERRWQAAKLAGLTHIPVVIRELSDRDAVAVALIENIQREELTPAEEARALQRLIRDFELTHQQAADAVGRSRAAVTNLLRLLDLPAVIVALLDSKAIGMGHARALLGLDDEADRERLGQLIADRGLSVRETEKLVRHAMKGEGRAATPRRPEPVTVTEVHRSPAVHVQLHKRTSGAGKIIVDFSSAEHQDALVDAIKDIARQIDD